MSLNNMLNKRKPNRMKIFTSASGLRVITFILGAFSMIYSACTPLPNIQGKGEDFLQGVWNQDSVAYSSKLSNYTQHQFKFTCDSVYINFVTHSKINFYQDSCYNNGIWKEYAKGVYAVKGDTLFIGATFTHANNKQKISGCYRIGRYDKNFLIKTKTADTLMIQNMGDQKEIKLSLKEKITCVQKAL